MGSKKSRTVGFFQSRKIDIFDQIWPPKTNFLIYHYLWFFNLIFFKRNKRSSQIIRDSIYKQFYTYTIF
jgi:hypothetical protein